MVLGTYSTTEFENDYQLDLGSNVRGSYITQDDKNIGLLIAHMTHMTEGASNYGEVCGGSVYWQAPSEDVPVPLWAVEIEDPLTLGSSIRCSCGLHGYIRNGVWVAVSDN